MKNLANINYYSTRIGAISTDWLLNVRKPLAQPVVSCMLENRVRGRCSPGGQVGMKAAVLLLQTPRRCAPRPTKQDNSRRFTGDSLRCTRGSETSIDATSWERETRVFLPISVYRFVFVKNPSLCCKIRTISYDNNIIRDSIRFRIMRLILYRFDFNWWWWSCEWNCRWCYKDVRKFVIFYVSRIKADKIRYFR